MKKNILLIIIACIISIPMFSVVNAEKEEKISLSILNQNVDGLPLQTIFANDDRLVITAQKELGKLLNKSGYDIICVQEDFQYHNILAAQMTNYKYCTYTSGSIPLGDGLNIFSIYPIYNVERVTWEHAYGALTNKCDELTLKGFLKVTIQVGEFLIDVYNAHHEGGDEIEDKDTRATQFEQLHKYIKEHSTENPVVIVGDLNARFYNESAFYDYYVAENGFTDAWVHMYNNDNYFTGEDKQNLIDYYEEMFPTQGGNWDSIERVLYRNSDEILITCGKFEYVVNSNTLNPTQLTDHCAAICHLTFEKKKTVETLPSQPLKKEVDLPAEVKTVKFIKSLNRAGRLIVSDLFRQVIHK